METRYNVYFAGEVLPGREPGEVRTAIGQLFKANDATVSKLFSGRLHLVKRDCDKATALKYKQAMEKAGARPVIKKADVSAATAPTPVADNPVAEASPSAAERIAALAAAPDVGTPPPEPAQDSSGVSLAPPQSDVLRPEERKAPVVREVDTGALAIDATAAPLAPPAKAAPAAPDTAHLSMGEVGETIPTLANTATPLQPDIDALALSPEGTDFSDCAAPEPAIPELDLSQLVLAPEGSEVLDEMHRNASAAPAAPDTDHIQLRD